MEKRNGRILRRLCLNALPLLQLFFVFALAVLFRVFVLPLFVLHLSFFFGVSGRLHVLIAVFPGYLFYILNTVDSRYLETQETL